MKTLLLVRHAKSSWDDSSLTDFDRPLNGRGEKDAPRMGKMLKKREVMPDLIYSSPAVRALATAKIFADALGYSFKGIVTDRQLYHASEDNFLRVLRQTSDEYNCVMIFGHNPGMTDFANDLFDENIDNIPTAGVVGGKLKIDSWREVDSGCGSIDYFEFPKNLKD